MNWKWNCKGENIQIYSSEIILAWKNGSQGQHFGKILNPKFLKGLRHSALVIHLQLPIQLFYPFLCFFNLFILPGMSCFCLNLMILPWTCWCRQIYLAPALLPPHRAHNTHRTFSLCKIFKTVFPAWTNYLTRSYPTWGVPSPPAWKTHRDIHYLLSNYPIWGVTTLSYQAPPLFLDE